MTFLLPFIRYMVNKYSYIDENRIATSGVSYGGYVVGMMLAASREKSNPPIRCGVSVSPVVEWRYYGKFDFNHFLRITFLFNKHFTFH